MNRDAFMARLREGLRGLPPETVDEIVADYETHFAEGIAAGRSEDSLAEALGDPGRLARELKAEAGLKRWEEKRDPAAAAGAIFAVLGLGAVDILILLPVLVAVGGTLFGLFVGAIAVFFAGGWLSVAAPTGNVPWVTEAPWTIVFVGMGLMSGAVAAGAVLMLAVIGLVNLLVRYGRLHYRLLKPAIES